jgi:hypothetical protein
MWLGSNADGKTRRCLLASKSELKPETVTPPRKLNPLKASKRKAGQSRPTVATTETAPKKKDKKKEERRDSR